MSQRRFLSLNTVHRGRAEDLLEEIEPESVSLSVWSPPYFVGKSYEKDVTYECWQEMLRNVIAKHYPILKPGAFLAVNIADILCFADETIPRFMAENLGGNRLPVGREDILRVLEKNPGLNRYQIAEMLGVSEQTVDRRMNNNNIRGGKHQKQTRVNLVGGLIEESAYSAGLYLYDRRVWVKDPCWENSQWHTNSYRAVDEFEYVYIFWKPGITTIDRRKLSKEEWVRWGSRAVWNIQSVRTNDDHEAKFPLELPRRLIRLLTAKGDTVLDCFMGSGTSGLAAVLEDRNYIGIEKESQYVALAKEKITLATDPLHAFRECQSEESPARANGTCHANGKS